MIFNYKNIAVSYTVYGKGRAVVLLHGFLENSSMWQVITEVLSKKYKIICIDLLGHGKTESLGYIHSMPVQAQMVKAVLNHLHLRKYILIGHSMGGYVALSFANQFASNIKGLCLINSTALADTIAKIKNRNRGIKVVKQNYKTFIRMAIPMLFSEENRTIFKNEIETIIKEALKMTPQGIIAALEGMKVRKNLTSVYKTATYPIQMFIGKQDPALDYLTLQKETKDSNIKVVTFNDGHMSHIENKDQLILSLQQFIKDCFKITLYLK